MAGALEEAAGLLEASGDAGGATRAIARAREDLAKIEMKIQI